MTDPLATVTFRPIADDDAPFLAALYASTRADEMRQVPWDDAQKAAFLQMQFEAQHRHYAAHFADAAFDLVLHGPERVPIGRLYLDRRDDELRIIDIALLPDWRGRGIGGALMRRVLDEAAAAGKPVRIHVEKNNPALRLYDRLGFRPIEDQGVYHLMEWRPTGTD
ncbi:MAG: GNAT family N-acetyltransferase [Acidobacteriota bacterium]